MDDVQRDMLRDQLVTKYAWRYTGTKVDSLADVLGALVDEVFAKASAWPEPISAEDRLPADGQKIFWWCKHVANWSEGEFISSEEHPPGSFKGSGITCWVHHRTHVSHWLPVPPSPFAGKEMPDV